MPALLANVRINTTDRLDDFKSGLRDLCGLFEEYHIKVRGPFAAQSIQFAHSILEQRLYTYQHLSCEDWIESSQIILSHIQSNEIHIFLEDHKRCCSKKEYASVLKEFASRKLDYLPYSFFRAQQLDTSNILPLGITQGDHLCSFQLDTTTRPLLLAISPRYCTFSLCSIVSKRYLQLLFRSCSQPNKIYSSKLLTICILLFGYPRYKSLISALNTLLSHVKCIICLYTPDSPFNLEQSIQERLLSPRTSLVVGVPRYEMFANSDDDNGAYGESLVKRGRTHTVPLVNPANTTPTSPIFQLNLKASEQFDLTYYSRVSRITAPPQVRVSLIYGRVMLRTQQLEKLLEPGTDLYLYTTSSPILMAESDALVEYQVYDTIFPLPCV